MSDSTPEPEGREAARDPVAARKKAMDYLARREHSRGELLEKLERTGFGREVAAEVLERLAAEGLQDDARYVESFIRSRVAQGKGPARIRSELGRSGIEPAVVDEELAACGADWKALAEEVRRRKFGPEPPQDFPEKARQMRFLQYRGFAMEQIDAAVGADGDSVAD